MSSAIVVPGFSSERPEYVAISGWAAASFGSIVRVVCTVNRSVPPVGVGTENTMPERAPARGASLSSDRARPRSTRTAE